MVINNATGKQCNMQYSNHQIRRGTKNTRIFCMHGIQYFGGYQISCDSRLGLKYALIVAAVVSEVEII